MNDLISREELLNRTIKNPLHSPYITERDVLDCPPAQPKDNCEYWDSESSFCALHRPSAQPEWEELLVICDNCGHAIHVKQH